MNINFKITTNVKYQPACDCNDYEYCNDCANAEKVVEVEEELDILVSAPKYYKVCCKIDGFLGTVDITKDALENFKVELIVG